MHVGDEGAGFELIAGMAPGASRAPTAARQSGSSFGALSSTSFRS
jgi:hypothetical protein